MKRYSTMIQYSREASHLGGGGALETDLTPAECVTVLRNETVDRGQRGTNCEDPSQNRTRSDTSEKKAAACLTLSVQQRLVEESEGTEGVAFRIDLELTTRAEEALAKSAYERLAPCARHDSGELPTRSRIIKNSRCQGRCINNDRHENRIIHRIIHLSVLIQCGARRPVGN